MKLRIHRGAKETGGNCIELKAEGKTLLLDLGMPLSAGNPRDTAAPDIAELADDNGRSWRCSLASAC
jgi:ribonuclease J